MKSLCWFSISAFILASALAGCGGGQGTGANSNNSQNSSTLSGIKGTAYYQVCGGAMPPSGTTQPCSNHPSTEIIAVDSCDSSYNTCTSETTVQPDAQGNFDVTLPPGNYQLSSGSVSGTAPGTISGAPVSANTPVNVLVQSGQFVSVNFLAATLVAP